MYACKHCGAIFDQGDGLDRDRLVDHLTDVHDAYTKATDMYLEVEGQ